MCAAQVLHLARELQTPGIDKSKKVEWWAVSNYVWGFLDTDDKRFPKKPDFKPLRGSKGVAMYRSVPVSDGRSRVMYRRRQCACTACLFRKTADDSTCPVWQDPKFKHMVGRTRISDLPRRKSQGGQTTIQLRSKVREEEEGLKDFADTFDLNKVVAVNVADDDRDTYGEGNFWLAVVTELPKKVASTTRHSGSLVEEGSWGVRCLWLHLVSTTISDEDKEERHYRVAGHDEVLLDVRMVLQLPPADDSDDKFYDLGKLQDHSKKFTLSADQTDHIQACLREVESALRDTDVGGLSDGPADDEDGE